MIPLISYSIKDKVVKIKSGFVVATIQDQKELNW